MMKFWSICQNTFIQSIRQPIFIVLILVTFAILILEVPLSGWTMSTDYHSSDQKMLEGLGLSTLLMGSGLFLAAFAASSVLAREIEDRTALTVISKPVSRSTFILGKFTGVAAAVTAGFYLCAIVFLMTVRHRVISAASDPVDYPVIVLGLSALGIAVLVGLIGNYLFGWHFSSAAVWTSVITLTVALIVLQFVGKGWVLIPLDHFGYDTLPEFNPEASRPITGDLLVGIVLMYMAALIFCAVAVASSTRLGQVLTLLVCMGVFMLGTIHPRLADLAQEMPALKVLTYLAPNLTYFYGLDAYKSIPLSMVGLFGIYCVLYVGAILALGIALFQTRQLESQATSSSMPGIVGLLAWTGRVVAVALAVWGAVVVSMITLPGHELYQALSGAVLLLAGIGCWVLWGYFSRGQKWTYWLTLLMAVLALAWSAVVFFLPQVRQHVAYRDDTQTAVIAVIAAAVLLILVLPKTRHHFEFHLRKH